MNLVTHSLHPTKGHSLCRFLRVSSTDRLSRRHRNHVRLPLSRLDIEDSTAACDTNRPCRYCCCRLSSEHASSDEAIANAVVRDPRPYRPMTPPNTPNAANQESSSDIPRSPFPIVVDVASPAPSSLESSCQCKGPRRTLSEILRM